MRRTLAALVGLALAGNATARAAVCDSNLMIVLDRSCSMNQSPGGGEPRSKWEIAREAIGILTTKYKGQLRLGLIMFPDKTGQSCEQDGPIYVNIGPDTEDAVVGAIDAPENQPNGPCVTNIDTAIAQVSTDPAYMAMDPTGRRGFVLLVTDGRQSGTCGGAARDAVTAMNIQMLYEAGFPTYVVGFGGQVNPTALDTFAEAGGVPRMGSPRYYQADDAMELEQALDAIAGSIVGDPELGGCAGTPCPDGRCFGEYEMCIEGVCKVFGPDAGPAPDATPGGGGGDGGAGGDGDGGNGGGAGDGDSSGCGCRAGAAARGTPGLALLVAVAVLGLRRRRIK